MILPPPVSVTCIKANVIYACQDPPTYIFGGEIKLTFVPANASVASNTSPLLQGANGNVVCQTLPRHGASLEISSS